MENQPYIFISYSRKDKEFVDKLSSDLNKNGIATWVDTQQILPGSMWQDELKNGIQKSSAFIVILSNNYIRSSWTSIELALSSGKTILPIKIDDTLPENLPNAIKNLHWADFFNNYEKGFKLLLNSIPINYKNEKPLISERRKSIGYVFLSFSEEDSNFVIELRNFLKSQDFAYWDFEEGERNYHIQFFAELEDVINESEAVLSIISPSWKNSKWSIREFIYSEEIGKPVLLLRAKVTNPILAIAGLPFIDFTNNDKLGFEKLEKELQKRLN